MKANQREAAFKVISGIARKADFEILGVDEVRAIKTDKSQPHYRFMDHDVKAAAEDEDGRTFEWVASTEHVDSMGDIIRVAGWNTDRVKVGRCALLLNHDREPGPAGLLTKTKRGKLDDGVKALFASGRFHEADLYGDSEWAKVLEGHRRLVARGELVGSSVGFAPIEYRWPEEEEREKEGMARYGVIFEAQELLELSITCMPANRHANRKSLKATREAVRSMVEAGEIEQEAADLLLANLEASEDAWLRRMASTDRAIVPFARELAWMRGARPEAVPTETPSNETTEKLVADAIARVERAVSSAVRREVAAVIRETIEPMETAMVEAADRIEDAVERFGLQPATTSERAEGSTPSDPTGSEAITAVSTGTSRETPTNPGLSAASALLRSIDAATGRTDSAHVDPRPRQAGGVQE